MTSLQGEAHLHIDAPAEKVYELISDVTRMGEWSPECVRAEWIEGATVPAVGAKFKGHNKQGFMRWSTKPEVTAADPGKEFAFKTRDTTWRYRLESSASGGTDVTESFEAPDYGFFLNLLTPAKKREGILVDGMQMTLARVKAAAEGSAAG